MTITAMVEKLFPFAYSIASKGCDDAISVYLEELPFQVHEYSSGSRLNGWFIPPYWSVQKAEIRKNGKLIYNGCSSPLGVGVLSPSFKGKISFENLKSHLAYSDTLNDAIPYHWSNLYNPNKPDWFFCMPKKIFDKLEYGEYDVELETTTQNGTMKVLDYVLPGETSEIVLLNGHNCHPFQANDDLSGICVAIETVKRLSKLHKRRLTYRILIGPELHGPMFWLKENWETLCNDLKATILFKSVGNDAPLRLQHSYESDKPIDQAAMLAMQQHYGDFERGEFRTIYGNDETVFEAPPYNIPTITLTRWPFAEYHTDLDRPDCISEKHLEDCVRVALSICQNLEYDVRFVRNFKGLVCLSSHELYKQIPPVKKSGVNYNSLQGRWNRLMNCLPREIENNKSVIELSHEFNLPTAELYEYLMQWVAEGLLIKKDTKINKSKYCAEGITEKNK